MGVLSLTLLGGFRAEVGGRALEELGTRKGRALLAVVATSPRCRRPREQLTAMLWERSAEEQARASLRQTLASTRRALAAAGAEGVLAADSADVWLDVERCDIDTARLERYAAGKRSGPSGPADGLYGGDFLDGLNLRERAFESWVLGQRRRYQELAKTALGSRLEARLESGELGAAGEIATRLLEIDPLQEDVHRALMEIHRREGRRSDALRQFETCRELLMEELGVEPDDRTAALEESIRTGPTISGARAARRPFDVENAGGKEVAGSGNPSRKYEARALRPPGPGAQAATSSDARPSAPPQRVSIAALAFTNMSRDAEQEFFCDGLTEDIITELSRFPFLSVISRHSSFAFKGEKVDVKDVGEKLGVHYVVEGSVRRTGSRIRVTAQLIETATGHHIWAERYDRELDDVFEVQDDVTRAIVAIIAAQLGKTVSERAARKHPASVRSYEHFLQGNQLYARFNPDDNIAALECYERAIALDPQFAPAYAGLANTYCTDHFNGWRRLKDGLTHGVDNAREALKRDENNALARIALAWVYIDQGRWDDAELEFDRLSSLNSGDADILAELGMAHNTLDNFDVGIPLLEEAVRLNPLAPGHYQRWLGIGYYQAKRYRDAVTTLRAGRVDGWTYGWLAASYARLGEDEDARESLKNFLDRRREELEKAAVPADSTADLLGNVEVNFRYAEDWEHFIGGLRLAGLRD